MSRDDAYLLDMLVAARKALYFNANVSWERFQDDELLQNATMRMIEIVGEASARVSQQLKSARPEIPWAHMTGMRNRLVHEYFRVDVRSVWDTVQDDIPRLISLLEPLVPKPTE
jgi:uncharacterized protein with HEPN domain